MDADGTVTACLLAKAQRTQRTVKNRNGNRNRGYTDMKLQNEANAAQRAEAIKKSV
jgi:hypothetical protein